MTVATVSFDHYHPVIHHPQATAPLAFPNLQAATLLLYAHVTCAVALPFRSTFSLSAIELHHLVVVVHPVQALRWHEARNQRHIQLLTMRGEQLGKRLGLLCRRKMIKSNNRAISEQVAKLIDLTVCHILVSKR
jgi:hypothetical protein